MKKLLAIVLAAAMLCAAMLTMLSCGSDSTKTKETTAADTKTTLIMATNANFPPYECKEGNGYAGIDVEIATEIAKKLGMTLEIKDVEFGSIVAGVQTGKYDIGMAGMTVNDERKQQVNFSDSYAKGIQVVIVKEGSEYKSVDDFFVLDAEGNHTAVKEGVLVGVQQNTTGDIYCSDTLENFGFGEDKVKRYSNGADAVAALASGKLSAVVIDDQPAKEFVKANEGLTILEGSYADEDYAIAVGKENSELLEKINKALKELTDDGTIAKIVAKYIKAE